MNVGFIFLFCTNFMLDIEAYRILGIFPYHSRSHNMMYNAIAKGLLKRGHQIDVISGSPIKESIPNYTVLVNVKNKQMNFVSQLDIKFASEVHDYVFDGIATFLGNDFCKFLALPELQNIIKNPSTNPPYDLLIVESFASHCFIGLGYVLKVPVIFATSLVDSPWLDQSLIQTVETAYFPAYFTDNVHPMSFFERLHNTFINHFMNIQYRRLTDDVQNAYMKKYIDPNIPPLQELEKNIVVLALVNSYHSFHGVRPISPKLIEVAGVHIFEHYEKMPEELEKWMNESTAGVIYFTFGSTINIETFSEHIIRNFYSAFTKLAPVRVLMKIGNSKNLLPGLPDNVKILPWISQVAVLAHKNTKVFITHGGLMSTIEALTYGVPMIGISFFADQHANVEIGVKKNITLKLNHKNLSEKSINEALYEMLNNPKYRNAIKVESNRFRDRPLNAMNTTIYWIEYAIRHGPNALRSPEIDLTWWQLQLLDVYAFILISVILIISVFVFIFKWCFKLYITLKFLNKVKTIKFD